MATEKIKNRRAVIIAGGVLENLNKLTSELIESDYIICADSGYQHAIDAGITPDLIVGDFDSFVGVIPEKIKTIRLPVQKDDTDLHFAAKHALSMNFLSIVIFGFGGGRLDHTIAALFTLAMLKSKGAQAEMISDTGKVLLIENETISINNMGGYVSIFPYAKEATGVCLKGFRYPLNDANLGFDFPIGVSNEIIEQFGEITVKNGSLVVVLEDK